MPDPDNIDWEREGCLGCKQRFCTPRYYRLDNGEPAELTHDDVEHARAEVHVEEHFWVGSPTFQPWAWEEEHPVWSLALHVLYAIIIFTLILGLAVIA